MKSGPFSPLQAQIEAALDAGEPCSERAAQDFGDRLRELLGSLDCLDDVEVEVTADPRLRVVATASAHGARPVEVGLDLTELAVDGVVHRVVWTDGPQCAADWLLEAEGVLTARVVVAIGSWNKH